MMKDSELRSEARHGSDNKERNDTTRENAILL